MVSASQVISGRENGIRRSAARPRSWPVGVLRACSLSLSLRFTQGFEGQFTQNCQNCVTHNIANGKNLFFIFLFYVVCVHKIGIGVSTLKCQRILDAWMVQQYGDVVCVSPAAAFC